MAEEKQALASSSPSFNIWPPNQRTRDAVIQRLVETLSSPSVLSKRYGVIDADEAASTARIIEDKAFLSASASASASSGAGADDLVALGIETLQVYSKEISKLVLDAVKSRASSADKPQSPPPPDHVPTAPAAPSDDLSHLSPALSDSSES